MLYQLAQSAGNSCDSSQQTNPGAQNSCVFYDITAGNNSVPCTGGTPGCSSTDSSMNGVLSGANAGIGYDMVTGLGSVNATNLANAWKNVLLAGSQTTFQVSSASFAHGTPITLTGSVAPASGSGTPTGDVSLKTDAYGDAMDVLTLMNSGAFTGTVNDLPGGQYNLRAHYAGDATYAPSDSATLALTVTPEQSVTTITANGSQAGSAGYGTPLSLAVRVAGASGAGSATGTITLLDGATTIGIYGLTADGGVFIPTGAGSANAFAIGSHSLTASYSGDNSFAASTSGTLTFNVVKGTPAVVVGLNVATVSAGEPVGAHAVVSGSGTAAATGFVQFNVDGIPSGAPLALQTGGFFGTQAQASSLLTSLAPGMHTIAASYDGSNDRNYASVGITDPTEFTQQLQVLTNLGTKTTTTRSAPATANLGDTVTFIVNVAPSSATGTVTVWDPVGPRSSAAPIAGESVQIQSPWTQAGTTSLYAVYSGDANNASSASAAVPLTVKQGLPQVILTAPGSTSALQEVSLIVSVIGNPQNAQLPSPTGVVEFWDSLNGGPARLLTAQSLTVGAGSLAVYGSRLTFSPGEHSIHAHYRGDNNWQAADSASQSLLSSDFAINVPPPISITAGSATVSISPSGGFSGIISFTCPAGGTAPPAGYVCSIASVTIPAKSVAAVNATLNLTPSATAVAAASTATDFRSGGGLWGLGFAAGALLLAMVATGTRRQRLRREIAFASGCVLGVVIMVMGCGGGGGGTGSGPAPTATTVSSTNPHASFGTSVTFNVTVTSSGKATGMVQLFDNGQMYASQAVGSAGMASFPAANLPLGLHLISAQYLGDANTLPSGSAPITQVIAGSVPLQFTATSDGGIAHTSGQITVVVN